MTRLIRTEAPSPPVALEKPPGIEPLLSIDDIARILSCSRRLVERMRAAGKLPPPTVKIGKMPRWSVETIRQWVEKGGKA